VRGRLRVDNLDAIRRAAVDGLGLGYLPRWMVMEQLADARLQTVLDDFAGPPSPINAVYAAERLLARRAAVFIDFIAERFAATPGLNGAALRDGIVSPRPESPP
jgi:LysR family transcriptional regulator for bpeEF and oprC